MKYCTDDMRKSFDTAEECENYEKQLKAEEENKLRAELRRREENDKIEIAVANLTDMIKKYKNNYNSYPDILKRHIVKYNLNPTHNELKSLISYLFG